MIKNTLAGLILFANIAFAQKNSTVTPAPVKINGFAVVELFTSQGCRSCPPADKVLAEIKAEAEKKSKPVYVISYHVDYWNKYGWTDPFSKFAFTKRQNNYISANTSDEVYTPQVFINGRDPILGSDKSKITSGIEKALNEKPLLTLTVSKSALSAPDTLIIDYTTTKASDNYSLVITIIQNESTSKIGKGENAGKTLSYHNIVRELNLSPLTSAKGTVKIPVRGLSLKTGYRLLAYAQQKQTKKIVGVAELTF